MYHPTLVVDVGYGIIVGIGVRDVGGQFSGGSEWVSFVEEKAREVVPIDVVGVEGTDDGGTWFDIRFLVRCDGSKEEATEEPKR